MATDSAEQHATRSGNHAAAIEEGSRRRSVDVLVTIGPDARSGVGEVLDLTSVAIGVVSRDVQTASVARLDGLDPPPRLSLPHAVLGLLPTGFGRLAAEPGLRQYEAAHGWALCAIEKLDGQKNPATKASNWGRPPAATGAWNQWWCETWSPPVVAMAC